MERGPTITISFETGEGLEAGKTKLKYKDVDIGVVKAIKLSEDPTGVIVTAEMVKEAERHLVEDTRFWVVRARIGVWGGLRTRHLVRWPLYRRRYRPVYDVPARVHRPRGSAGFRLA
jgi:hypothetical protein